MHAAPDDIGPELEAVRRGDDDAAGRLVTRLHPLVMKIVRSHLPARVAEEDLAQDVFSHIFERLPRYEVRPGVPFEHWVSRLAARTCLDALRSERRRPEVRVADLPEAEAEWLDYLVSDTGEPPATDAADARELVERLLGLLPAADRLVLSLLDLDERSVAEVSALTGWTNVGVRVRAFRARNRLRKVATELKLELP